MLYLQTGLRYQRSSGGYAYIFDHARFTSHTINTIRRRPTTGNQNVYPLTANGLIIKTEQHETAKEVTVINLSGTTTIPTQQLIQLK